MASVIVSALVVRDAVAAAKAALCPPPNHVRSEWPRQEGELRRIDHAARQAMMMTGNVGLTETEFELLSPYLPDRPEPAA